MNMLRRFWREIVIGSALGVLITGALIGWILRDVQAASRTCVCKLLRYHPGSTWDVRDYGFPAFDPGPDARGGYTQIGFDQCSHGVKIAYSLNADTNICCGSIVKSNESSRNR